MTLRGNDDPALLTASEAARRIEDGRLTSVALVEACLAAGLSPDALSRAYAGPNKRRGLLLSFTNLAPEQAPAMVQRLARALSVPLRP